MLKGLFQIFLVLLLVVLGLFSWVYQEDITLRLKQFRTLQEADSAIKNAEYKKSQRILERAVLRFPQEPLFHLKLANLYHHLKRIDSAEPHYEVGLQLSPTEHGYRYNYARLLMQKRETNQAIHQLRLLLNQKPHYAPALSELGNIYRQAGNRADSLGYQTERFALWNWARFYYTKALQSEPKAIRAWYGLGELLQRNAQYQASSACYCQVIHESPNAQQAWFNLGLNQWYMNEIEDAIALMTLSLQLSEGVSSATFEVQNRTLHSLRQNYYLTHVQDESPQNIRLQRFPEDFIHALKSDHSQKPLSDSMFPEIVHKVCRGWVPPILNDKRPTLAFSKKLQYFQNFSALAVDTKSRIK